MGFNCTYSNVFFLSTVSLLKIALHIDSNSSLYAIHAILVSEISSNNINVASRMSIRGWIYIANAILCSSSHKRIYTIWNVPIFMLHSSVWLNWSYLHRDYILLISYEWTTYSCSPPDQSRCPIRLNLHSERHNPSISNYLCIHVLRDNRNWITYRNQLNFARRQFAVYCFFSHFHFPHNCP